MSAQQVNMELQVDTSKAIAELQKVTPGTVSSEYRLTKWVVLIGGVLVAAGGVLSTVGGGAGTTGKIMLAVGGAIIAWSSGKYAESRGIAKSGL